MKLRLAYPQKLVEVDNKRVYVFRSKLFSAPLEEVVNYYLGRDALLPAEIKAVAHDIIRAILSTGEEFVQFFPMEMGRKASA
ncbi:hypothetical protein [Thermococcus sp.]